MGLIAENISGGKISHLRREVALVSVENYNVKAPNYMISVMDKELKLSWACRFIDYSRNYSLDFYPSFEPRVGDVAVCRIEKIGNHSKLTMHCNRILRLYEGDYILGVFGNRYATDAFEGEVAGLENLNILTGAGMIGTVRSKHSSIGNPTKISFLGFLNDDHGARVNTKLLLKKEGSLNRLGIKNLIVTVGTGMNSGKTTTASKLIKGLSEEGFKVAACKLTGSVSHRDQYEMISASACIVKDFSDYGFPSTYLSNKDELINLFYMMLEDVNKENPDIILLEIADGLLQRETSILLEEKMIKELVSGVVLAAESAPSALFGVERLKELGYRVVTVSGVFTSSPLSVKEFKNNSGVPVGYSKGSSKSISKIVKDFISGEHK